MLINMNVDASFINEFGGIASYAFFAKVNREDHRHSAIIKRRIASATMAHVYGVVSSLTVFVRKTTPSPETKIYINCSNEQAVETLQGRFRDATFNEVLDFRNKLLTRYNVSAFYRHIPTARNNSMSPTKGWDVWCSSKSRYVLEQHMASLVT